MHISRIFNHISSASSTYLAMSIDNFYLAEVPPVLEAEGVNLIPFGDFCS